MVLSFTDKIILFHRIHSIIIIQRPRPPQLATTTDHHHHSHHTPQLISEGRMNYYQSPYRVAVHHLLPDARSMGRQLNQLNIAWKAILATMLMANPMGSIVILISWNYAERLSHSCGRLLPDKITFLIPFEKFILWQWKYFQREQIVGRSALIVIGFLLQPKTRERFHGYIKHQWNLRHRAAQDEYDNYGVLI